VCKNCRYTTGLSGGGFMFVAKTAGDNSGDATALRGGVSRSLLFSEKREFNRRMFLRLGDACRQPQQ